MLRVVFWGANSAKRQRKPEVHDFIRFLIKFTMYNCHSNIPLAAKMEKFIMGRCHNISHVILFASLGSKSWLRSSLTPLTARPVMRTIGCSFVLLVISLAEGAPVVGLSRRPGASRRLAEEARLYGDLTRLMAFHADILVPWQAHREGVGSPFWSSLKLTKNRFGDPFELH